MKRLIKELFIASLSFAILFISISFWEWLDTDTFIGWAFLYGYFTFSLITEFRKLCLYITDGKKY